MDRSPFLALALIAIAIAARAESPDPEVTGVQVAVTLQEDGWTRVGYLLEFTERAERPRIPRWGPFESGFEVHFAGATRDGEAIPVRLLPASDQCLTIRFLEPTREGSRYAVRLEYRFPGHPLLPARRGIRMLQWRPASWDLPVRRTEVQVTLPVQVPENLAGEPALCGEWARQQGVLQLQPEPPAEGSGFSSVPDDAGRSWLRFRALYWGTLPSRSTGVALALPASLVRDPVGPVPASPPVYGGPEPAEAEPPEGALPGGDAERKGGDEEVLVHPRWIGLGAVVGMVAAFAWLLGRARMARTTTGVAAPEAVQN